MNTMASTGRAMTAFQRGLPETTKVSRRTVLDYSNKDLRHSNILNKLAETRYSRRQNRDFQRRNIQHFSDVEMVTAPPLPRRSAVSQRYGPKACWKDASACRTKLWLAEARSSHISQRNQEAYAFLCSMSGQVSSRSVIHARDIAH